MSSIHRYFDVQLHLPLEFSTLVRNVSFLNFGVINCLQWLPLENQRDEGGGEVLNVLLKILLHFHGECPY